MMKNPFHNCIFVVYTVTDVYMCMHTREKAPQKSLRTKHFGSMELFQPYHEDFLISPFELNMPVTDTYSDILSREILSLLAAGLRLSLLSREY